MTNNLTNNRSVYWDIAKGITIILVVLGHAVSVNPYVRKIIFSYHMPFFFIANAYFIKNYDIARNAKRSVKSLLKPYAIVCLISAVFCVQQNTSAIPNYRIFWYRTIDMFVGISKISTRFQSFGSVWLVWFVICLFAARMMYICLMHLLQKTSLLFQGIVMLLFCACGSIVGHRFAFLPWSLDVSLVALPFMWFGDHLKLCKLSEHPKRFLISALCCLGIWVLLLSRGIQIEMATRSYPGRYLSMICAISGSVVVLYLSWILERLHFLSTFLGWCGYHSMIILALHCFEMRFIRWENFFNTIPLSMSWLGMFIVKLIFILFFSYLIVLAKQQIDLLDRS